MHTTRLTPLLKTVLDCLTWHNDYVRNIEFVCFVSYSQADIDFCITGGCTVNLYKKIFVNLQNMSP